MDFETFKDFLFSEAEQRGFTDMELYYSAGSGILLSLPEGEQYNLKQGISFKGTAAEGTGSAYTERLSEASARFLIETVLENVKVTGDAEDAPHYNDGSGAYAVLPDADPAIEDPVQAAALRSRIAEEIAACGNLSLTTGVVHAVSNTVRMVNSRGLDVSYKSNYIYSIVYMVADRDGALYNSLLYRGGTRVADIDAADLIRSGYAKAGRYFGAEQIETGTYNIVFPNDTASLLVQGLAPFFSGESVLDSISRLGGKLGERVAGPAVTLIDDPLDPRGVFVKTFDAEGRPASRRTLVHNGVLTSYLNSSRTAEQLDNAVPGSFHRLDYNVQPAVYPSNFYLAPGGQSLDELIAEMGDGLYVTDVTAYFHGAGINAASGEYSIPATGFVVKDGKIDRPFDGVTIAGSLYDFLHGIKAVGNDLLFGLPTSFRPGAPVTHGCYGSPSIRVDGITVSGK